MGRREVWTLSLCKEVKRDREDVTDFLPHSSPFSSLQGLSGV